MAAISQKPTLQGMTELAQELYRGLTEKFDTDGSIEKAHKLYQQGRELIQGEIQEKPVIKEIVSPVVITLSTVLSLDTIQHQYRLCHHLSKTYRIFMELSWYQCWRQQEIETYNSTRDALINTAEKVATILPPDQIATKFELRCAEQGARCLFPAESVWKTILGSLASAAEAVVGVNAPSFFSAIKEIFIQCAGRLVDSWYLQIYPWRWQSELITTVQEFESLITPAVIQKCLDEGHKHAVCLTMLFMNIIKKNPQGGPLGLLAFNGNGKRIGLVHLLNYRNTDTFTLERLGQVFGKPDRFGSSRLLTLQYLLRMSKKDKYKAYKEASNKALVLRKEEWNKKSQKQSQEDLGYYTYLRSSLEERSKKNHEDIATNFAYVKKQLPKEVFPPAVCYDLESHEISEAKGWLGKHRLKEDPEMTRNLEMCKKISKEQQEVRSALMTLDQFIEQATEQAKLDQIEQETLDQALRA